MACALGIEQDCDECRMRGNGKGGKKMTNFERIKGMSVEELAEFILKVNTAYSEPCMTGETDCKWEDYPTHDKGCKDCFKEWLESECEAECLDQK